MKIIKRYVDLIDDELCGAKNYAEMYVEYKANNDSNWAQRFKEMSQDELRHASFIHELTAQKINRLNDVYKAPQEMVDKWTDAHTKYVEKEAWIRQMLNM